MLGPFPMRLYRRSRFMRITSIFITDYCIQALQWKKLSLTDTALIVLRKWVLLNSCVTSWIGNQKCIASTWTVRLNSERAWRPKSLTDQLVHWCHTHGKSKNRGLETHGTTLYLTKIARSI